MDWSQPLFSPTFYAPSSRTWNDFAQITFLGSVVLVSSVTLLAAPSGERGLGFLSGVTDGAVSHATLALVTLPEPVANPLGDVLSLGEPQRLSDCADGEPAQNRRQRQQQP